MKQINRWLSCLLVFCMVVSMVPLTARAESASGTCGENLTWTLSDDGTLTISGTGAMDDYENYPWHSMSDSVFSVIISKGVTSISVNAFSYCNNLTSIVIPDTVISIGYGAFHQCISLNSVDIPDSIVSIGGHAFHACSSLTSVDIPDRVTSISDYTFYDCTNLTSVDIPNGVTSIGDYAFGACENLTILDIPNSVTSIGDGAFYKCSSLTSMDIPNNVISIGDEAFYCCFDLINVNIPNGVTSIGDSVFGSCKSLTSVDIPDSVVSIGGHAFYGCSSLTSVDIPNSVTSIGDRSFSQCSALSSINIPDSVTTIGNDAFTACGLTSVRIPAGVSSIGDDAFSECSNLTGIYVDSNNLEYSNDSFGCLFNKRKTVLYQAPGAISGLYVIPDSVTSIDDYAFINCRSLTSVDIPNSVTSISDGTFWNCENLTSVNIPSGVTSIGDHAFDHCENLTSVNIPSGVTSIGEWAFHSCENLTNVDIPDSVTYIGDKAFYLCKGLISVTISDSILTIGNEAFAWTYSLSEITFRGNAPIFSNNVFTHVTATAYYPTNNPTWTTDVMQDYGGDITWVPYGGGEIPDDGTDEPDSVPDILIIPDGTFQYMSAVTEEPATYGFNYNEHWFFEDNTTYNHELAQMSIRMAMAAANTGSEYITELFTTLKMQDIEDAYVYPTADADSIGYAIGSKRISDAEGDEITLIAVAVRGGGYHKEWASNVMLGLASTHEGFKAASNVVFDGIQKYIDKIGAKENMRIWITGFSRAAAVSNLVAAKLNVNIDAGYIPGGDTNRIYAYCFATPRSVTTEDGYYKEKYKNVFNIVNPADLVPMVAPDAWDFRRCGITYYLPSSSINSHGFHKGYSAMQNNYRGILMEAGIDLPDVSPYTATMPMQHRVFTGLVTALSGLLVDQTSYSVTLQDLFVAAIDKLCTTIPSFSVFDVAKVLLELFEIIEDPAKYLVKEAFGVDGADFASDVMHAHYPELYLAWMDTIDGDFSKEGSRTRYLKANCPVDITVFDSENNIVAQIRNDVVQEIEGSFIEAAIDVDGQKVISLPADMEFRIEVTATADGTMSYQIEEYDLDQNGAVTVTNYYDIPIAENDILKGTIGTWDGETVGVYSLEDPEGNVIPVSNTLSGDELQKYTVSVSTDGNGVAGYGGVFLSGEYVKIVAEANDGEEFLGWFVDEELISTEAEYRFRVENNVAIVGKFTENSVLVRISGSDRSQTAIAAADALKEKLGVEKFKTIILASGKDFADALAGSYLASTKGAPILLYNGNNSITDNLAYIQANLANSGKVYILGGNAAVPENAESVLVSAGIITERLQGNDRFETNMKILEVAGVADKEILICTGRDYADCLSASASGLPILMVNTNKNKLTAEQTEFLTKYKNHEFTIIGGSGAVSETLENAIEAIVGNVNRVYGSGREETSIAVANRYFDSPEYVFITYSRNFPDGLCGGPLAYAYGAPLLLVAPKQEYHAADYVKEHGIVKGYIMGGAAAVSEEIVEIVFDFLV